MRHMLVAEHTNIAQNTIAKMNGFYFQIVSSLRQQQISVRCKWSGRMDTIHIVTTESRAMGVRFSGQLMLMEDNNFTYGLYMYLKQGQRAASRRIGAEDEETLFWHWSTQDALHNSADDDRDCFTACLDSLDPEVGPRRRR